MFGLRFKIKNPGRAKDFVSYYIIGGHLVGNKFWELQASYYNWDLFLIDIDFTWRGEDHVGPRCEFNIFGYTVTVQITDNRHWDHENNCWGE